MKVHWKIVENNLMVAYAIEELYENYKNVNILGITEDRTYTIFYTINSNNIQGSQSK